MRTNNDANYLEIQFLYFDGPFLGSPSVLVNGVDVYTGTVPDAFEFSRRV